MGPLSSEAFEERAALMPLLAELRKVVEQGRALVDHAEEVVEQAEEEADHNGG